ncbi:MAG: hypothetical protein Nkreftii_002008 [Candidatus Nitrospira kreftii]|uniref:Uncharacterized protein n=1 Tax=Candidatus Nitrospira kreftii TaxID=2652173 RepID=A0A7S8FDT8_9BACT|nr:MAG: hypothetical protein Nkreftii_002008 [Candidatus Nitrospira kreftii]
MTDAIDITTEQRNTLRGLLRRFLPGVAVWAYGSRVKWTARPNSDLDLVAFTTPEQRSQAADLKEALAESNLPFPVDLHVWDDVPERFREIIRKDYMVVQEAKQPESKTSMPGEWPEMTTFANLIEEGALEIGDGYRAKNEELGGDGLIFLRAGHVTNSHVDFTGVERFHAALEARVRSKLSIPGDAVVTTKGNSTGRTTFVTSSMPPFVYSPHLSYWRSKDRNRIEGGFLRYWSKSSEFSEQLSGMKASTDMAPYLSLIDQKRLRISLPPIEEQRAIAHFLGALDEKIELNRKMNETLEAMARALFKSWFIDFDPVRRNAARTRNQPSPGLRPPSPSGRGAGGEGAKHEGEEGKQYRGGYDFTGLVETARILRKAQTSAENLFWELVRDRQFMGLKFRRQHQLGDYIVDFYCHEQRLVIELDGGIHSEKRKKDHKRDAWMEAQGFTVLRFRNEQLVEDPESVLTAIAEIVQSPPIHSLPLGEGLGEGVRESLSLPLPLGEGWGQGVGESHAFDHLFPDSFEGSDLGKIPKGWRISSVGDHMANFDSMRVPVSGGERAKRQGPYPYHGAAGVMDYVDDFLFDGIYLLVGEDGSVVQDNGVAVTQYVWGKLWVNNHAHVLQGKHDVSTEQLYLYFHFQSVVPYVTGAVQPKLSQGRMNAMPFLFAGTDVCRAFAEMVQPLFTKLRANAEMNTTLVALRDTLLPKLITGQVRLTS